MRVRGKANRYFSYVLTAVMALALVCVCNRALADANDEAMGVSAVDNAALADVVTPTVEQDSGGSDVTGGEAAGDASMGVEELPHVAEGALGETSSLGSSGATEASETERGGDAKVLNNDLVAQTESGTVPSVEYCGHVQNIGWQNYVKDGAMAGTSGQSLRVEALRIRVASLPNAMTGGVQYRMHVQNVGWQDWVSDDAVGGTSHRSLRVESMQLKLYGLLADSYDIWYRVHAQDIGWMGWAKNGETSGTAGKSLRLEAIQIRLTPKNAPAPSSDGQSTSKRFIGGSGVSVMAHVQNVGWMNAVGSGGVAGTTGRSLRMEAVIVSLDGLEMPGDVRVQAHVQNIGWTSWAAGGSVAGTMGRSLRVEALRMELTGEAAEAYDIWYRAHVANVGWMGWAKNGDDSGTSAMGTRIEAIQVVLVGKNAQGPTDPGDVPEAFLTGGSVSYSSNVSGKGWQSSVANGAVSGTTGESRAITGFNASYVGGTLEGSISYRAHVSNVGWQGWVSDAANAGDGSNAIEALCIALNGRAAHIYDVWYRVHISDVGWLGWARNGEVAGSVGVAKSVQAVQVLISSKETPAPGSTINHEIDRSFFYDPMTRKAQGYGSDTAWLILVDTTLNRVGIYQGSRGNWQRVDLVTVSCGAPGSSTVKGVFKATDRGYSFGGYDYTCYYWTRFYGDYLFHSVLYHGGTFSIKDGTLGANVSHGCVRMPIDKAKWIHDNIPYGTTVVTY